MLAKQPNRTPYSKEEAAQQLGISVEHLRNLIRSHIVDTESVVQVTAFHQSDLVAPRFLSGAGLTAL